VTADSPEFVEFLGGLNPARYRKAKKAALKITDELVATGDMNVMGIIGDYATRDCLLAYLDGLEDEVRVALRAEVSEHMAKELSAIVMSLLREAP
jgi:hypothetical protein